MLLFAVRIAWELVLSTTVCVCVGVWGVGCACMCPSIFLVEAFGGNRQRGNGQLAKSVKYLSGRQHRDEAALLLSMFTSMSEWEQDMEKGATTLWQHYTKCCVGVFAFLPLFTPFPLPLCVFFSSDFVQHFALFCFVSVQSTILRRLDRALQIGIV